MILILSPYLLQYIFKRGGNILYFEKFLNRGTQKTEEEKILFCCSSKRFFWSSKENKSNQEPISFAVCWVKQYCYTWKKLTFFSVSRPWRRVKNTMKFKYLGGFLWTKVFTVYYYFLRLVLGQNFFRFSVYLGSPGLNFTLMLGSFRFQEVFGLNV